MPNLESADRLRLPQSRDLNPTESRVLISPSALHGRLLQLSESILSSLSKTREVPPENSSVSVKSMVESLLQRETAVRSPSIDEHELRASVRDFSLACALLVASRYSKHDLLSWITQDLSELADSAFSDLAKAYADYFYEDNAKRVDELGIDYGFGASGEKRLVIELIPEVLPLLKDRIKESSIDKSDESDEAFAASAKVPVGYAIVAAYQLRWFVTQVDRPYLGKMCNLVVPCALTALDHWSPHVKSQGMISFTHLAKNVNAAELGWYEDPILDACCQNIASDDDIWHHVVEMSVLLVTSTQRNNPRSPWFERLLNEMLSHLERQPRNKERRTAWLELIEPLLNVVGLVLLAHFRRLFPLFFLWMHADDDETLLLVLQRAHTVIRLTWIRNTPYVERLVDELLVLYKEAALKGKREEIRTHILQILLLLQQCKGMQFEAAWDKHRNDPNLAKLVSSLSGTSQDVINSDSATAVSE
ncbi:uncharacterized protein At2g39910 [Rhodamnia argentea]|uniref:Uncharacterized protein At2g39910 n=1 Tax=Rhodamnia argentea TaxID=178133 RepID=A0A8B8Q026_9MYRT|nr:uncharacterized protein At2g39910 [Rhodamnia argentea]XP_030540417.1 uncharacterized protein At2g39910 [Rhodamnia argentea]XP_030540418.1 uncharacterized protein At2g39910 [Rhodamnia argentea]XP_030540419.1 uncharacterized protein At2g39910 [Rhodamnia argentea]XP_030540420.1 uncharacterized protein At2g39910 [Rhodamnia argentea]XP_048140141.1 uncharacterized protein At2g39910 [Rhodamnia argentea]